MLIEAHGLQWTSPDIGLWQADASQGLKRMESIMKAKPSTVSTAVVELKVPPQYLKRIPDPHSSTRYSYVGSLPISEARKILIGNANPRGQNPNSSVYRDISQSLQDNGEVFHLLNRGLWVSASDASYDNTTQKLTLKYPLVEDADQKGGILDGGHTWRAIDNYLKALEENGKDLDPEPWLDVRVRVKAGDIVPQMAGALNTSAQLRPFSLANFAGELKELKEMAKERLPFFDEIAFTENEGMGENGNAKEYDVLDLLQRLTLYNTMLFPNTRFDQQPVIAYYAKSKLLDLYVNNKQSYLSMSDIVLDVFRMPDIVEAVLPALIKGGKFGNYTFARGLKNPKVATSLAGLNGKFKAPYEINRSVVLPLAAALRPLAGKKADGSMKWREKPIEFFHDHGKELFQILLDHYYNKVARSLSQLGKSGELWQALHSTVYGIVHPEVIE